MLHLVAVGCCSQLYRVLSLHDVKARKRHSSIKAMSVPHILFIGHLALGMPQWPLERPVAVCRLKCSGYAMLLRWRRL